MMHHHVKAAISAGISFYITDLVKFKGLFPLIPSATLEALHAEIVASPPEVRPFAEAGTAHLPVVVVQLQDRTVLNRPLGGQSSHGVESMISKQTVQIEVMGKGSDLVHVLADLTLRVIQTARSDFLSGGYITFQIESSQGLDPHEQLAAEEMGVFLRRFSISAMVQEDSLRAGNWDVSLGTLSMGLVSEGGRITTL